MKKFVVAAALVMSMGATADASDAGLTAGFLDWGDAGSGFSLGARFGHELKDNIALDVHAYRNAASTSRMGVDVSTSQILIGAGARYYFAEDGLQPFASGHLNYGLEAEACTDASGAMAAAGVQSSVAVDTCGSGGGGITMDIGGGVRYPISDSLFTDGIAAYDLGLGDNETALHIIASVGMMF